MFENPYIPHIRSTLPRLLSLFDQDRTSDSYGTGDRSYWAWGLIDFGNATFQGAIHGLAILWRHGLWPFSTSKEVFLARIDAMFKGAGSLARKDGSLEEAFPMEGSFCVTALVAFDLLCALDLLKEEIAQYTRTRWQAIIQPMITFLIRSDETHGLISNHLATAVAALVRWHALTGEQMAEKKARTLLQRIIDHQSKEGWFREYDGADPGYQSLCTYYLADVHKQRPDWDLLSPLRKSIQFLWYFAHPDGSFGGSYGSRCTRFYNPAGLEALADEIPEAYALAIFMSKSIAEHRVVTLSSIDEPNLVPWFNAYCWAAVLNNKHRPDSGSASLPCTLIGPKRTWLPRAGLLIDKGADHYTIVSTHKGGVVMHFKGNKLVCSDSGIVVRDKRGALGSTQSYEAGNHIYLDETTLIVQANVCPMPRRLSKPVDFLILRLLSISLFRVRFVRELVKQLLVRLLITGSQRWPIRNTRRINLGPDLTIQDECPLPAGYEQMNNPGPFVAIHMASQGYWQIQDEEIAL